MHLRMHNNDFDIHMYSSEGSIIGICNSPKCDVNPQPTTQSIWPLVGRTSGNCRSVMHILAVF